MTNQPLKVFIGYDHRQPIAFNVAAQSIYMRSSKPVSITPLVIEQLPIKRTGLTPFTWSRFLVPWLCDFHGWAVFVDADVLVRKDISELFDLAEDKYAVMAVTGEWHFEWASMMLFNCGHPENRQLTPEHIENAQKLHGLQWTSRIGELPAEWNHIVLYDEPKPDPALVHYTGGVPIFPETVGAEFTDEYHADAKFLVAAQPWEVLMGPSVHKERVLNAQAANRQGGTPAESGTEP